MVKELYAIDMEKSQYPKLLTDLPDIDIAVKMGCNVVCPYLPANHTEDWGLEDPSGKCDQEFKVIISQIESKIKTLADKIKNNTIEPR